LTAAVTLWAAVHSWLASLRAKGLARRLFGDPGTRVYRLAYNAFAGVTFLPILVMMRVLPDKVLYVAPSTCLFVMLAGQGLAAACLLIAMLQTDTLHFVGLRQLARQREESGLMTGGFYGVVRHPLYLFGLVFLWLTPYMSLNLLTVDVLLTAYIFVGATFEERRLLREFGTAYEDYRRRTPMIIPLPKRSKRRPSGR
jgi:protein-S-isoprenylcysteine O-methyltransferase Ste14